MEHRKSQDYYFYSGNDQGNGEFDEQVYTEQYRQLARKRQNEARRDGERSVTTHTPDAQKTERKKLFNDDEVSDYNNRSGGDNYDKRHSESGNTSSYNDERTKYHKHKRNSYHDDEARGYHGDKRNSYYDDGRRDPKNDRRSSYYDDESNGYSGDKNNSYHDDERRNYNKDRRKSYYDDERRDNKSDKRNSNYDDERSGYNGDKSNSYHDDERRNYNKDRRKSYYEDENNGYHSDKRNSNHDDEMRDYNKNKRNSYYDGERSAYHNNIGNNDIETNYGNVVERESPKAKVYHDQRFGRDQNRCFFQQVFVLVQHWSGCEGKSVCDNLQQAIFDHYADQVDFMTDAGPLGSFEVFINGKLLFSRLKSGGYPFEDEVILAIDNVRNGRNFSELRHGVSRFCVIL